MREPIGTTRKGQFLFGIGGMIVGVGSGLGLATKPDIFEPLVAVALNAVGWLSRTPVRYDPSHRAVFAILFPFLGVTWGLLFAYAFAREPARNRAIDAYLWQEAGIDRSRRTTMLSPDDGSV